MNGYDDWLYQQAEDHMTSTFIDCREFDEPYDCNNCDGCDMRKAAPSGAA